MEHTKRKYLAPELTVVSFRTECGYALSGLDLSELGLKFGSDELYAEVQRTIRLCAEINTGYHTEASIKK